MISNPDFLDKEMIFMIPNLDEVFLSPIQQTEKYSLQTINISGAL
jgi:hypothetical protein